MRREDDHAAPAVADLFDQLAQHKTFARAGTTAKDRDAINAGNQRVEGIALFLIQFWIERRWLPDQRITAANPLFDGLDNFHFTFELLSRGDFAGMFVKPQIAALLRDGLNVRQ